MKVSKIEFWTGILVLIICAIFSIMLFRSSFQSKNRYIAIFREADIGYGTPVKISGYTVGKVYSSTLTKSYRRMVELDVESKYLIPKDSEIKIQKYSPLGTSKYLEVVPGLSAENMKNGDKFENNKEERKFESIIDFAMQIVPKLLKDKK